MSWPKDRVLSDYVAEVSVVQEEGKQTTVYTLPFRAELWDFSKKWDGKKDVWKWDRDHVRMPCSPQSQSNKTPRWKIIEDALVLRRNHDLEISIKKYNQKYINMWKLDGLQKYRRENQDVYNRVVPKIINMALSLPRVVTRPIPLLRQGREMTLNLSQVQIAAILANAFLCTFPWRNDTRKSDEYRLFPTINFSRLFADNSPSTVEKIKSLFHYFERVHDSPPTGVVTYIRRHIAHKALPDWSKSNLLLPLLDIRSTGNIEKEGRGMLQVDFANKLVGGGVLGRGCVQEEVRFTTNPELIAARLFTEELLDNEALLIVGSECYSRHSGYAASFKWEEPLYDNTPRDRSFRRRCAIIAIDAVEYKDKQQQYDLRYITRELNKAYVGFHNQQFDSTKTPGVATGNWGCGAFNGDPELKALIQLMSAAQAQRPCVTYLTFGDKKLERDVSDLHKTLSDHKVTVGLLFNMLTCYNQREGSVISFILNDLQGGASHRNPPRSPSHHGSKSHGHGSVGDHQINDHGRGKRGAEKEKKQFAPEGPNSTAGEDTRQWQSHGTQTNSAPDTFDSPDKCSRPLTPSHNADGQKQNQCQENNVSPADVAYSSVHQNNLPTPLVPAVKLNHNPIGHVHNALKSSHTQNQHGNSSEYPLKGTVKETTALYEDKYAKKNVVQPNITQNPGHGSQKAHSLTDDDCTVVTSADLQRKSPERGRVRDEEVDSKNSKQGTDTSDNEGTLV